MASDVIDPGSIPLIAGDMNELIAHADTLTTTGAAIADTGARVYQTWQGLAPVYIAPEAGQLLAATGPVMTVSASVGEDIGDAAAVIRTYATETAAIQARLVALRVQAVDLVAAAAAAQDESTTVTLDDRSAELNAAVAAQVAAWEAAQLHCANALRALTGAPEQASFTSAMALVEHGGGRHITPRGPGTFLREIFPIDEAPPVSSTGNPPIMGGPSVLINVPAPRSTGVADGPGSFLPLLGSGIFTDKASRGGGAKQLRQLQTGHGDLTLGELAQLAADGDQEAKRSMKMVKQAGTQGKGGR